MTDEEVLFALSAAVCSRIDHGCHRRQLLGIVQAGHLTLRARFLVPICVNDEGAQRGQHEHGGRSGGSLKMYARLLTLSQSLLMSASESCLQSLRCEIHWSCS